MKILLGMIKVAMLMLNDDTKKAKSSIKNLTENAVYLQNKKVF